MASLSRAFLAAVRNSGGRDPFEEARRRRRRTLGDLSRAGQKAGFFTVTAPRHWLGTLRERPGRLN